MMNTFYLIADGGENQKIRPKGAACYISQTWYIGDYSLSHRTGLSYRNSVEPVHLITKFDEADHLCVWIGRPWSLKKSF